jgi:RNA polymerase sigma-70 factor, ECF subfamily
MSQISFGRCSSIVDALSGAVVEMKPNQNGVEIESIFHAQYARMARVITRVIRDPARAEELAVDVFLKWSRNRKAHGENAEGWLYRTAVRMALNELRRQTRQDRYERLFELIRRSPTPEDLLAASEEQQRVRVLLGFIKPRQAELLLLRSEGLTYDELASVLNMDLASIGTLLSRAQQAFRKEYLQRYGKERYGEK